MGGYCIQKNELKFSYLAGTVDAIDKTRFERQLFRTTRGNCYVRFAEIEQPINDPSTGVAVEKMVFIVFYKVRGSITRWEHNGGIKQGANVVEL